MNFLRKNIAANFAGNIWQTVMGILFVPFYIKFMGIEAYGLVGIYITLQAIFAILDMGLGQTLNREMARLSILPGKEQEMNNLTKSLELIYWGIAITIGIIIIIIAPIISQYWIKSNQLDPKTIKQAILIMGIAMAIQWPVSLYVSGLRGLQKLVTLNGINIVYSTLKGAGAVLVLWLISPTIKAFFLWQISITFCYVFFLAIALRHNLPKIAGKAIFQKQVFFGIWKFAAGVSGITILMAILAQIDKIILVKLLSLEVFGYYTLANTLAMSVNRLIYPITGVIYPRLTQLVSIRDEQGIKLLYHKSCQFVSVLLFPITICIALFSYEILLLWTQNSVTAQETHIITSILIWGTALNGTLNMPYKLQWAYGWTKLGLYINLIAVILFIPFIIYMTNTFGVIGTSFSWVILNAINLIFVIHIMHTKLLKAEKWHWYLKDISIPLFISLIIPITGRLLLNNDMPQLLSTFILLFTFSGALILSIITTPVTKVWLSSFIKYFRKNES